MINIIDKLPDNNLEKTFFWEVAFKLRDLEESETSSIAHKSFPESNPRRFDNILFMNYGDKHEIPPRTVIFMNADEQYRIPEEVNNPNVVKVFKQYCTEVDHPKLFPMPLGVPTGFDKDSKVKPIKERDIDVVFMGQYASNRTDMLNVMSHFVGSDIQTFFGFTNGFNRGISRNAYSDIMRNSKIAICPRGTASPETFRLYEAASVGCLVVTCDPPDNWIYRDIPFFTYKETSEITTIVENLLLLSDEVRQGVSDKTNGYYQQRWSAKPVAEVLYSQLIGEVKFT
jgi:hypothetical protein